MFRKFFSTLAIIAITTSLAGCSSAANKIDIYAESACILITSSYNNWGIVSRTDTPNAFALAEKNFQDNLDLIFREALTFNDYSTYLKANTSLDPHSAKFSGLEKVAGILKFKEFSESYLGLGNEKWQPGHHVTLDGMFSNLVSSRCGVADSPRSSSPIESKANEEGLPLSQSWPPAGYEEVKPGIANKVVDHTIDCENCGGLTWEYITNRACPGGLVVTGDFVTSAGTVVDTMTDVERNVEANKPFLIEIWSQNQTTDLRISTRSVECR
jgi:hypothetical protein